jgi:hypothetical protein
MSTQLLRQQLKHVAAAAGVAPAPVPAVPASGARPSGKKASKKRKRAQSATRVTKRQALEAEVGSAQGSVVQRYNSNVQYMKSHGASKRAAALLQKLQAGQGPKQ